MTTKSTKSRKEPEVSSYTNKKGEKKWRFRHRYYDSLGNRKEKSSQGFPSENAAIRALLQVKSEIANGNAKKVEVDQLTVSEWMDIWYETHKNEWKITSQNYREKIIRLHIKPLLGHYRLQKLDKATYKRVFINKLLQSHEPSSVQLFHRIFKIAINAAVDNETLPRNRFSKITIPDLGKKTSENFLTANELKVFIAEAKQLDNRTNFIMILLLAYTGLRIGESLGLTWNDIDFEKKTITINRTRDRYGARTPKTEKSYRTILVDDFLLQHLATYRTWCTKIKFRYGSHLKSDNFIFISPVSGNPCLDNTLRGCFKRICKKAGLKQITPHGLRHTHATLLIGQRIPVKIIADRLGNTPQMILDVYGHSFKELEEESVQAFGSLMNM